MVGQRARKRILIGAGCLSDAGSAIAIAERLAGTMVSEIGGLLLEDRIFLDASATVCGTVVSSLGAVRAVPDPDTLRRLIASDAKAFRDRLRRFAEAHGRNWSFERRSGETISGLCAAARDWDWLLIGQARVVRHSGSIVAVAPGDEARSDAPDLAHALSDTLQTRTIWVDPALDEWDIMDRVNAANPTIVLIDAAQGPVRTVSQIRRLCSVARCPVLVLAAPAIGGHAPDPSHIPSESAIG